MKLSMAHYIILYSFHHLSGPNRYALAQTEKGRPIVHSFSFTEPKIQPVFAFTSHLQVCHPTTRVFVRLLGPCFRMYPVEEKKNYFFFQQSYLSIRDGLYLRSLSLRETHWHLVSELRTCGDFIPPFSGLAADCPIFRCFDLTQMYFYTGHFLFSEESLVIESSFEDFPDNLTMSLSLSLSLGWEREKKKTSFFAFSLKTHTQKKKACLVLNFFSRRVDKNHLVSKKHPEGKGRTLFALTESMHVEHSEESPSAALQHKTKVHRFGFPPCFCTSFHKSFRCYMTTEKASPIKSHEDFR